jgi:hypothetical protein
MWLRNVLFITLVTAGTAVLAITLYPPSPRPRTARFDPALLSDPEFTSAVGAVNKAVSEGWSEADIRPAGPADDLTVIRRLSLALTGTVPSVEEIRQFEKQPQEYRVQWWVAYLLQDRRSADYLAERFARAFVGTEGGPFIIFRRRRFVLWLSDQLHEHRPYNEIVASLITAKGLWTDQPAANFITATASEATQNQPEPERLAGRVTRAFLGVRLDCAQCHNHPFESWKQQDFQRLTAFFGGTNTGLVGVYEDRGGSAGVVTDKGPLWIEVKADLEEKSLRYTYAADQAALAMAVKGTQVGSRVHVRTEKDKPTHLAKIHPDPGVPFLPELLDEDGEPRERLAKWVTHPKNGYFARATVNRIWALLFGRPMVEPIDDITTVGKVPPALQALADDFVAHDFDLRRLIHVIAETRAYRLDSRDDTQELTDVHERLWAAFPMSRMRPEQVAGALIQASSLETIDQDSHILAKLARFGNERDFVQRYGDMGDDEFDGRGGTIPQRLILMNGELISERNRPNAFGAAARIALLAPDDRKAVEIAYLAVLTRRPTEEEAEHFVTKLAGAGRERAVCMEDIYWSLLNSTEFAWTH